jgi:hypothetical protein
MREIGGRMIGTIYPGFQPNPIATNMRNATASAAWTDSGFRRSRRPPVASRIAHRTSTA